MKVVVTNKQQALKVDLRPIAALTRRFMTKAAARMPETTWRSVSVVLVDDTLSEQVNTSFLNHTYATDVISFAYDPLPGENREAEGEIFVNTQQAIRAGLRHGGTARELALYIAHGCNHLSGATDDTPAARRQMRARENRWLADGVARQQIRCMLRRLHASS